MGTSVIRARTKPPAALWSWLEQTFETSNDPQRMLAMEGVRGLAILLVWMVHTHNAFSEWLAPQSLPYTLSIAGFIVGGTGVDLFFVLSGYLIYGTALRARKSYLQFLKRRFIRIYPAFTCVFTLYVFLSFFFPQRSKIPPEFPDNAIYLLQSFLLLPGVFSIEPLMTVAWSLSFEAFFYLTMPLLVRILSLQRWSPARRIILFAILSVIIAGAGVFWGNGSNHGRAVLFLAGIIVFELLNSFEIRRKLSDVGEIVVTVLVPLALIAYFYLSQFVYSMGLSEKLWQDFGRMAALLILWITWPALVLLCCGKKGFLNRFFSSRPLRWLGNMSYSFYLIHSLAIHTGQLVFRKLIPPVPHQPLVYLAALLPVFALSLLISAVLFILIEKPFSLRPQQVQVR
jgi:peptidoglycan/LPS O-acetylase OafA/YrhL